jgi:hypothetical protein
VSRDGLQPDAAKQSARIQLDDLPEGCRRRPVPGVPDHWVVDFDPDRVEELFPKPERADVQEAPTRERWTFDGQQRYSRLAELAAAAGFTDAATLAESAGTNPADTAIFLADMSPWSAAPSIYPSDREYARLAAAVNSTVAECFPLRVPMAVGLTAKPASTEGIGEKRRTGRPPRRDDFTPGDVARDARKREAERALDEGRAELAQLRRDLAIADSRAAVDRIGRRMAAVESKQRTADAEIKQDVGRAMGRLQDLAATLRGRR